MAAEHAVPFISVDSDRRFLKAVEDKIASLFPATAALRIFRHADIGLTARWGFPVVLARPSPARLAKFARYSDPPAECADGRFRPDFILVDGRFRVACALKWVRLLRDAQDWTIAVDDYTLRPHYGIIGKFARLDRQVGRMAVFKGALPHAAEDLDAAIQLYETDDA